MWLWTMGLAWLAACGADCDDGYAKANDGRCYPLAGDDDDDDDDDKPGVPPPDDTGRRPQRGDDTGRGGATTTASRRVGDFYLGEPELLGVGVYCEAGQALWVADARGHAAAVTIDVVATGEGAMPWSERVVLMPQAIEPFGWWTTLSSEPVAVGVEAHEVGPAATAFTCDALRSGRHTWVVQLLSGDGVAACEVVGHDPSGVLHGTYEPTRPLGSLQHCVRESVP